MVFRWCQVRGRHYCRIVSGGKSDVTRLLLAERLLTNRLTDAIMRTHRRSLADRKQSQDYASNRKYWRVHPVFCLTENVRWHRGRCGLAHCHTYHHHNNLMHTLKKMGADEGDRGGTLGSVGISPISNASMSTEAVEAAILDTVKEQMHAIATTPRQKDQTTTVRQSGSWVRLLILTRD